MSIMKVRRTIWLPADLDLLVQDEQARLEREHPGMKISYSDALRSLLSRLNDLSPDPSDEASAKSEARRAQGDA